MMTPHHQDAIKMARAELTKGVDPDTRQLANAVISAQKDDIKKMNAYREAWFGAPSRAGGVPAA